MQRPFGGTLPGRFCRGAGASAMNLHARNRSLCCSAPYENLSACHRAWAGIERRIQSEATIREDVDLDWSSGGGCLRTGPGLLQPAAYPTAGSSAKLA